MSDDGFSDSDDGECLGAIEEDWLEQEEPEQTEDELAAIARRKLIIATKSMKVSVVEKSHYVVDNVDLFYALCEVEDWGFSEFSDKTQENLMKSLVVTVYGPGDCIIAEGSMGTDVYIVVASEETAEEGEVEVSSSCRRLSP
jgi:hypothetical protein